MDDDILYRRTLLSSIVGNTVDGNAVVGRVVVGTDVVGCIDILGV